MGQCWGVAPTKVYWKIVGAVGGGVGAMDVAVRAFRATMVRVLMARRKGGGLRGVDLSDIYPALFRQWGSWKG